MNLNQFYTKNNIAECLIKNINIHNPKTILDLGFGTGKLLCAAQKKWPQSTLVGIDIDSNLVNKASEASIQSFHGDGTDKNLPYAIKEKFGEIDLILSNPPYFSCPLSQSIVQIIKNCGLESYLNLKRKNIPAELVFFAQNINILKINGEMGIILPAGLISGQRWQSFRRFVFSSFKVSKIIQLPAKSFKNTEAKTFILILQKKVPCLHGQVITLSDETGCLDIPVEKAIIRADYSFYKNRESHENHHSKIHGNDFNLFRGSKSHFFFKKNGINHFHTSHFKNFNKDISLPDSPSFKFKNAISGDILITRIGSRSLGKSILLKKGSLPISDCIIVIRAKNKNIRDKIWRKLISSQGKNFFEHAAMGVGAKYITHLSLKNFLTSS